MTHRGPDDAGQFVDGAVGLGHRRLSIIDLSEAGHQPMITPDRRFVIAFNGEIYNYRELRRALEADGVTFASNTDTEVILQLHATIGDSAVQRLNGIFAYALYDTHSRRLLLVRDRAGVKPLYYAATQRGVAFASEIKALFQSDIVQPRLNASLVGEHLLFRHVAGPRTLFDRVCSLPPGHTLEIVDGVLGPIRAFWSIFEESETFQGGYGQAVDALDDVLSAAVRRQMVADVPVGTFCSGGIDSSLVTALASRHAGGPIMTFSVGFDEAQYDESRYARQAAAACRTVHHELRISERQFAEYFPTLTYHHDLPLNFANSIHIYALSVLAREHVTVALTGEGADELFAGYPRYHIPRLVAPLARLPAPVRSAVARAASVMPDHRAKRLAAAAAQSLDDLLLYNPTAIDRACVASLLDGETPALQERREKIRDALAHGYGPVAALSLLEFQTYLASILDRQDKMSMATSLEARVPFLDNEVIAFARRLPMAFLQTARHRKRILKDVALRYLPREIVHRKKSGFGVPLAIWFRGEGPMATALEEALSDDATTSLLDRDALQALFAEHRRGKADHSDLLWSILTLAEWRRRFRV